MTIHERLVAVSRDCTAIAKRERSSHGNFDFRGIDAVLNAVGPLFRQHGVYVLPDVLDVQREQYTSRNGALMTSSVVKVSYTFTDETGDHISCTVYGESADSGDKGLTQAMSVALRVALLQVLTMPTDEPDPDNFVHERAPQEETPPAAPEHQYTEDQQNLRNRLNTLTPNQRKWVRANWPADVSADIHTLSVEDLEAVWDVIFQIKEDALPSAEGVDR